jgi:hypothetical protein
MPPTGFYGSIFVGSGGKGNATCDEPIKSVLSSLQMETHNVAKELWGGDNPEKWKWAYGAVEVEARRTQTTEPEIVESYWKFTVLFP